MRYYYLNMSQFLILLSSTKIRRKDFVNFMNLLFPIFDLNYFINILNTSVENDFK
jgi:hypothetical protein